MSGGLCEPSRGLVCGREWVAGSSSWCSTFPGCQPLGITGRYGVKGVAREGRALARPHHRAGARRSQDASHSALPGGTVSREWPGRDEHWLVRVIELVLDVPRMPATRHYREVRCQGSGLGGTSTGSSASSSWCSTFPGNSTLSEGSTLGITGECGVKGVTRDGRAPARPLPNTRQLPQLVKLNSSPSTPALITAPGSKSPARMRWASGFSIQRWIARLSGRAP